MRPDAVVFDLDGTLVDSAPDIAVALNRVLERRGYETVDVDVVKTMIGGGPELLVRRALAALGQESSEDEVATLTSDFEATYFNDIDHSTTLNRGARELLDLLASQNIAVGVCSNKPGYLCQASIGALGVQDYFGVIRGSGNGLPNKPDPAMLLATIAELGASAANTLYVGDSATDVATARAAAVDVALIRGGYTEIPADRLGADWVLDGLLDVPAIWEQA